MLNGLYVAAGGMMMQSRRVDLIANNLANMKTPGYKKERPAFTTYLPQDKQPFPQNKIRESEYNQTINSSVKLATVETDFEQGFLRQTGKKYDLAIENSNVFFAVDTPFGVRFTRDGSFTVNENNELVNKDGFPVLSDNLQSASAIQIPREGDVVFTNTGQMMVDGNAQGSIFLGEFEDQSALQKVGRNLFTAIGTEPEKAKSPRLSQGFLEGSNVNAVDEMVRMLEASRGYETYQKVITTMDEINAKAANDVGRMA